jgi:hypothetical protein
MPDHNLALHEQFVKDVAARAEKYFKENQGAPPQIEFKIVKQGTSQVPVAATASISGTITIPDVDIDF